MRSGPFSLAARWGGGVNASLGQFRRFPHMTAIRLGLGCERQPKVFILGLARKPLLLFRHRGGVRAEKGKAVESIAKQQIIQFSCLRLVDALPRFVEPLQGKGVIGESLVGTYVVRCKAHSLPRDLRSFFI